MSPWLQACLAITLAVSAGLALWPSEPAQDLLPPPRVAMRADAVAARAGVPVPPPPATPTRGLHPGAAILPTRPADWPTPPAAALAAWQGAPEAPPRPVAAPPAARAARAPQPAFPYRWIGQLDDGHMPQVLLASAQRTVAVRLDAVLDNRWRLQLGAGGVLQALPLPEGEALPVPGAPLAAAPHAQP